MQRHAGSGGTMGDPPQPLLWVLEGWDAAPLPASLPLWGKRNLSEELPYFNVCGGEVLKMTVSSIAHF